MSKSRLRHGGCRATSGCCCCSGGRRRRRRRRRRFRRDEERPHGIFGLLASGLRRVGRADGSEVTRVTPMDGLAFELLASVAS